MASVGEYLRFHLLTGPRELIRIIANFLIFVWHYFSIGLLAKTLLVPWRRLYWPKQKPGFDFGEWFGRLTGNLTSRVLGALIRSLVIIVGLGIALLVLVIGSLAVICWWFLPIASLPVYLVWSLGRGKSGQEKKKAKLNQFFQQRLAGMPLAFITVEDKEEITAWFKRVAEQKERTARFWELENLLSVPGIGKDWAAGYTITLDKYTVDLTAPKAYSSHLVGRQKEAEAIERVLSMATRRGCLLVGEPGVGKQTIVENFAKRSREGKTVLCLRQKRILLFYLSSLLGKAKNIEAAKSEVLSVLKEAGTAGNVVLVIDDFDCFISNQEGGSDLTSVLVQAVEETGLPIIGLTTPDNFAKFVFPNKKILECFETIEVTAPTAQEALIILEDITPYFERRTGVVATFPALKEVIKLSERWVIDIPFPEKAIELLDDALVYAQTYLKTGYLQPEHIRLLLAQKTKIPLTALTAAEKEKLVNIEAVLHQKVINQNQAIDEIAKALRRRKAGVGAAHRPIGTFLFLGPTGVGKTETAKALAEVLFGSESQMIRLDMAQFQNGRSIERLIGSFGKAQPGILTSAVRQRPYAVLLLDEIEKASLEVMNLFLTAIDEGYLADAFGKKVSFENLLIIGTSNAGAEFIRQKLIDIPDTPDTPDLPAQAGLSTELVDFCLRQGLFSPEFINRFDAVVVYEPLGFGQLRQIARLQLEQLNKRLAEKKISLEITDELVEKIARLGFDPVFGARPMKRVIADKVEDVIAKKLLAGEIKRGEKIRIEV